MGYIETAYSQADQLSWMWDCFLILPFNSRQINFRVESIDIPSYQFELERKLSQETYIKSVKQPDEVSITFRESVSFHVYDSLQEWLGEFYDDDKKTLKAFFSPNEFDRLRGNIELVYYSPPLISLGRPKRVMRFKLLNCLPVGITPISANYSDGDALKITFSFLPEKVEFKKFGI
jgi:hypothetical protein